MMNFSHLTDEQEAFAKFVFARQKQITAVKQAGKKISFKNIPNTAKISVTQHGVFTDSYLKSIPATLDRLTRINALTLINMLLMFPHSHTIIKIHDRKVKLNTPSVSNLIQIMRENQSHTMSCICCGLTAKYAYIERSITASDKTANFKNLQYSIAFYGVRKDGSEQRFTVDHIDPTSAGGRNVTENMQIMCGYCNSLKSSIPNEAFTSSRKIISEIMSKQKETA